MRPEPCERVTLAGRKREVSEVRLSSWTLAQDTDKPKFAEHYHDSTEITSPEGTRGKYTRDSMPVSATQYALHSLPLVPPLCTSTTLTQCANILTAGTAGGTRAPSVCALQVYGGGKYWAPERPG